MTTPRRKRMPHTATTFTDKQGQTYHFSLQDHEVHASYDATIIASVYLVMENDVWRVQRAWVELGFRRRGVATALYDYAFRMGFRPLRGGRVQTTDSAKLWRHHMQNKSVTKGEFVTKNHPAQYYWWPNDLSRPRR